MARAVLEIAGDTSALVRSLRRIDPAVKAATAALRGDFRQAMSDVAEQAQRAAEAHARAARAIRQAHRAAAQSVRDESREQTRIHQTEGSYRENAARSEVAAVERAERAKTQAVRRGSSERLREYEREKRARAAAWGSAGASLAGGAASIGSQAIGMTRDAVRGAAAIETTINNALVPAGYRDRAELAAAQRAILERARSSGIDAGQIASGLASAQEFTSMLTGGTARERASNLSGALEAVDFAANSRQDIGQVLRLRGVLAQQGVRGADARSTMMALTGIGRAGSVELGNLTREALGPLMQNIAFATGRLGPNASAEQRAAAVRQAAVRTLAVGEVGAAAGLSSRDAINALAKLDRYTLNPAAMGRLRDRLMARGASGRALAGEMFEETRDAGGQRIHRLRGQYRESLNMTSALLRHTGGNAAELANMLASAGRGREMVMDSQTRRLVLGLASQTATGETIAARVQRMAGEANYTEADLNAERQIRESEQTTRLATNEETRRQGLSDNTASLNRLTERLDSFAAKNPIVAAAGAGAATAAAPVVGRAGAQALVRGGVGAGATATAGRAAAALVARAGGALGFLTSLLTPGNEGQGYFDDRAAIRAARGGASAQQATAAGQRDNITALQNGLRTAVQQGVVEGMARATVQVPPAAQQHAQTQSNLAPGSTPTTGR